MKSNIKILTIIIVFTLLFSTNASAQWTDGQAADLVLGQADFTTNSNGVASDALDGCSGIAIDFTNGKMYVADEDNNRVLRFSYPITSNQQAAELVFGQANFTSSSGNSGGIGANTIKEPSGVAVDNTGRLWISDSDNHRVLWFNAAYNISSNKPDADGVLGQADFISGSSNRGGSVAANTMYKPEGLLIDDNGTLWVCEQLNNRLLRFDNVTSKSNGADADGVLGQSSFTSGTANLGGIGANTMYGALKAEIQSDGTLWVVDVYNHRILRFDNAANKSNGANADGVLGQTNFTSSFTSAAANKINRPNDVAVDATGRLYVTEVSNHRVTIFNDAANKANGADADNVLGQSLFTTNSTGKAATKMNLGFRSSLAIDHTNNYLWVSDSENNRVTRFSASSSLPVELTSFKGEKISTGAFLKWQTASEKNNKGFEIERSHDSQSWETIGFVAGNSTTQEAQNYTYTDEAPLNNTNYYRLKQIDFDGAFEYSQIIHLDFETQAHPTGFFYPNPSQSGIVNLDYHALNDDEILLLVFDTTGKLISQISKQVSNGDNNLRFDFSNLEKGIYIVKIGNQENATHRKLIIK